MKRPPLQNKYNFQEYVACSKKEGLTYVVDLLEHYCPLDKKEFERHFKVYLSGGKPSKKAKDITNKVAQLWADLQ